jgi:transposase
MFLPRAVRVYVATEPTNLRKSFDGLSNDVRHVLDQDPLSGHVFIFVNRRRNQVKLLVWTRGGYTIVHKRLERGTFAFTRQLVSGTKCVQMDVHELSLLLEGITIEQGRISKRWEPFRHRSRAA